MEDVRQYTFASLPGSRKQFEPSGMLCTHAPLSTFTVYSTYTQGDRSRGKGEQCSILIQWLEWSWFEFLCNHVDLPRDSNSTRVVVLDIFCALYENQHPTFSLPICLLSPTHLN